MAVPATASIFAEPMDPYEILDFEVGVASLLEVGETVSSYTVTLPTESSLLGLTINTTAPYATSITGNVIKFYLAVTVGEQANSAFTAGVILPIEISVTTNAAAPRKKQRTVAVRVIQR